MTHQGLFMLRRLLVLVLLLPVVAAPPARAQARDSALVPADTVVPPAVTAALRHALATGYVSGVSEDSLRRLGSAEAMLNALRDRHTMLLSPKGVKDFQVLAGQQFGGIGARLGSRRDTTYITGIIPGSPAAQAGLRAFDRVLAVNDTAVIGTPVDAVVERIRGPVGSSLTLTVLRPGAGQVTGPLTRASVGIPSVPGMAVLDGGVGVVRLSGFGEGASREFARAVDGLVGTGELKGLIIDVRGNPGGLLEEAMTIAAFFLPAGQGLVEIRPRPPQAKLRQETEGPARYPASLPVAVVVNEISASAAEVLAGALQDAKRATVFGRQSYGKGSVQQVVPLVDGWAVKMTIATWHTPAGRGLDRGVQPYDEDLDVFAKHDGGVIPDVVTVPDSSTLPPAGAIEAIPDTAWVIIADRLTDWTETVTREMETPGAPTSAAKAPDAILQGIAVPTAMRAPLAKWLAQRVTAQAMGARFGEAASTGYELAHDRELAQVAAGMAKRRG